MLPLFDLMMQAQNGKALEAFARQFNLAQDQAAKAVAALMPAFSEGLKRHSSTPFDFASLMQKATSGNYASYFEDLSRAFTPEGIADGNKALRDIFGSSEIASAIAAQAAQLTGVGQDVLKQMMPAMADTMMGGIVKQMMGQVQGPFANPLAGGMGGMMGQNPFASAFSTDAMGAMTQQWLETIGLARRKPDPMAQMQAGLAAMMDTPFARAMQSMFQPQAAEKKPASAAEADPFGINPWLKSVQEMMTASSGGTTPKEQSGAKPAAPDAATAEGYGTFVNSLFDSGLDVQKSYQASLTAIFDQWTAKPGTR